MRPRNTFYKKNQIGKLRNYNVHQKDRVDTVIASGGVAIFTKNNIPCEPLNLITDLEAVTITTYMQNRKKLLKKNCRLTKTLRRKDLIARLPTPFILTGDFNCHNYIWGSSQTDPRGSKLESLQI